MVDVGWLGTTRLMINSILKEEIDKETIFFYYGIRKDVLPTSKGPYISYNRINASNEEMTFIIEEYFSASPFQTTLGYQFNGINVVAITAGNKEHDYVTKSNRTITEWITNELNNLPNAIQQIVSQWGDLSLASAILKLQHFDLQPLIHKGISRKFNILELVRYVFLGAHKTLYDKGSIALSVPKFNYETCCKMHDWTSNIRNRIAKKLKSR